MKVTTVAYFCDNKGAGDEWSLTTTVHFNRQKAVDNVIEYIETVGLDFEEDDEAADMGARLRQFVDNKKKGADLHLCFSTGGDNHFIVLEEMDVD